MLNKEMVLSKVLIPIITILCCCTPLVSRTILVTGGAGFIGSHVVEKLLERQDTVVVVDILSDSYNIALKQKNIRTIQRNRYAHNLIVYTADIRDKETLDTIFAEHTPDAICHLAARAGVRASIDIPEEYVTTNILGTLTLFELAKKYQVNHIVYASSSSIYGNMVTGPFMEDAQTDRQTSVYAVTKKSTELLAYSYYHLHGIQSTGLRFFTVYGPRGRSDMAPFIFLDAIHRGALIYVYGDGTALRDFTYIDDITDGILRALDKPQGFRIFNMGRGKPISISTFISIIENIVGKKAFITYKESRPEDVLKTEADITLAKQELGYNPVANVREGMAAMYQWYLNEYLPIMICL